MCFAIWALEVFIKQWNKQINLDREELEMGGKLELTFSDLQFQLLPCRDSDPGPADNGGGIGFLRSSTRPANWKKQR